MKVFTYSQYIKNIHKVRLNYSINEEGEEYKIKSNNTRDKIIKEILKDKEEVAKMINDFFSIKIKEEELIEYKNKWINKKCKVKEIQLIYKLKNKNMFFIIKCENNVENEILYKILKICINIICQLKQKKKTIKNIIIIPIVIYIGDKKWIYKKSTTNELESRYVLKENKIDLEYNLIDINKIQKRYLIEKSSMFSYLLLIEKTKDKKENSINFKNLIKKTEEIKKLNQIAKYILYKKLEEDDKKELLEKINKKIIKIKIKEKLC